MNNDQNFVKNPSSINDDTDNYNLNNYCKSISNTNNNLNTYCNSILNNKYTNIIKKIINVASIFNILEDHYNPYHEYSYGHLPYIIYNYCNKHNFKKIDDDQDFGSFKSKYLYKNNYIDKNIDLIYNQISNNSNEFIINKISSNENTIKDFILNQHFLNIVNSINTNRDIFLNQKSKQ